VKVERVCEAALLSRETSAAVGSAFNALTETVKKHEPTLEDVVRETLRPMLKSWLDENLPGVVERMVQAEIERVTRGRENAPRTPRAIRPTRPPPMTLAVSG
jgi:cell pole-organizing protein PopZ